MISSLKLLKAASWIVVEDNRDSMTRCDRNFRGCFHQLPFFSTIVISIASRLPQGRSMSNHSVLLLYLERT